MKRILLFAMFAFLLSSCLPLPAATVIDSAKLGQDTTLVHTGAAAIAPFIPAQYQWLISPICALLIGLLIFLSHVQLKQHITNATKTASILLIFLIMGGLSSCAVTKTTLTTNGGSLTENLGKGYYLQEYVAVHTGVGQNDTVLIQLFGNDSITNPLIQKADNYVKTHLVK